MDFKERIIKIGIKNTKLAELMGCSAPYLSNMIQGNNNMTEAKQEQLNDILTKYEQIEI